MTKYGGRRRTSGFIEATARGSPAGEIYRYSEDVIDLDTHDKVVTSLVN